MAQSTGLSGLRFLLDNRVHMVFNLGSDYSLSSFWPSPNGIGKGRPPPLPHPMLAVPSRSLGQITNREFSRPFSAPHSIWQQSQERQGGVRPGLTQCSSHPARSPAVGVVPAQACWGSQRIPSPCHKWLWAGTPAHSNRLATARAARPRSFHSPSYIHSPLYTLTHTHTHTYLHTHLYTLTHTVTYSPSWEVWKETELVLLVSTPPPLASHQCHIYLFRYR